MKDRHAYRQEARILRLLANEARLMILMRLHQSCCSVGELVDVVGLRQSTVSKHLALLRAHGLVADRRQGTRVVYRLLTPCVLDFLTCVTRIIHERKAGDPRR